MLFVDSPHGVFQDGHVAIAQFVVLVNEGILSLSVALVGKLLSFEEVSQLACLMDFAEGALGEERAFDFLVL